MLFFPAVISAQPGNDIPDTTAVADTIFKDPKKAALYSAILPGLGQFYNKKYWKVPIVYAGFGTLVYFIDRNSRYYNDLRQALIDFPDYNSKYYSEDLTEDQLERGMEYYRRNRDLSYIGTAGFYLLQIIDASVDAHLFNWNVGEDITLRIEPSPPGNFYYASCPVGFRACLSF